MIKNILLILLLATSCIIVPSPSTTFQGRMGKNLSVKINDQLTYRVKNTSIRDINGLQDGEINWQVVQNSGKFCLTVSPLTEEFGEFQSFSLILTQINKNTPSQRWKRYQTDLDPVTSYPAKLSFEPNKKVCLDTFYLTSRLKYDELPKGSYLMEIRYSGRKNWDLQEILLVIE